jgi:hypothetical protein
VGFRGPILGKKAQVISFSSQHFWSKEKVEVETLELDLKDNRGIRSMEFQNDSLFIIAGASPLNKSAKSELVSVNLTNKKQKFFPVPNNDLKLEGFEFISKNKKIFVYDSQANGLPTLK